MSVQFARTNFCNIFLGFFEELKNTFLKEKMNKPSEQVIESSEPQPWVEIEMIGSYMKGYSFIKEINESIGNFEYLKEQDAPEINTESEIQKSAQSIRTNFCNIFLVFFEEMRNIFLKGNMDESSEKKDELSEKVDDPSKPQPWSETELGTSFSFIEENDAPRGNFEYLKEKDVSTGSKIPKVNYFDQQMEEYMRKRSSVALYKTNTEFNTQKKILFDEQMKKYIQQRDSEIPPPPRRI